MSLSIDDPVLEGVLVALAVSSGVLLLLSAVALPWFISRLPSDYFTHPERNRWLSTLAPHWAVPLIIVKNGLGLILAVAGLLMLVLPGQGILTLVVALSLLDFPGKYRLERWILHRPRVFRVLNWIRRKLKRQPFQRPSLG